MKLFAAVLTLLVALLRRERGAVRADQSTEYTFFRNGVELPGPSMSFNVCLGEGSFEFQFKTFVKRALVLYQDDHGKSDYIEVTLQDGKIYLAFNIRDAPLGTKREWFQSEKKYNDFEWHKVTIKRSVHEITISVGAEGKTFVTGARSDFTSDLQIGGFPTKRIDSVNEISRQDAWLLYLLPLNKRGFFNACVKNIKYGKNEEPLKPIHDSKTLRYFVKDGCHLTYCHKPEPVCKNRGICSTIDDKKDSSKVKCDCRWTGFEGANCTVGALELTLNGSYQVSYHMIEFKSIKLEKYKFRIITKETNAIILYAKGQKGDTDTLKIEISDSMLKITSNLGGGEGDVVLRTKKQISDNKWHLIEYERNEKKMSLIMDGKRKYGETKIAPGLYINMDYNFTVYLSENRHPHENIKIQDFIWHYIWNSDHFIVKFVSGLFEALNSSSEEHYTVTPKHILPMFNREIHWKPVPSKTTITRPTVDSTKCMPREGHSCTTAGTPPTIASEPGKQARKVSDDSSVTWIVVVTVICALVLFAVIAFLVHKWNKRYSGDFEVNRKEIGPSATVVHYKDSCYKEKQRQAKI